MVIVMSPTASEGEIGGVVAKLGEYGFQVHRSTGVTRTVLGAIGKTDGFDLRQIEVLDGVESVTRIGEPFKLASRSFRKEDTVIEIGGVKIGGDHLTVMAGPCAVESREQMLRDRPGGGSGGARCSSGRRLQAAHLPLFFPGSGRGGAQAPPRVRERHGLAVVTEVMEASQVEPVLEYADMLQIGARNMQNFTPAPPPRPGPASRSF